MPQNPQKRGIYNLPIFIVRSCFSRKDGRRISIRSPASSALGAARATMTLTCSNIQRNIRALGLIPSNIQVNYQDGKLGESSDKNKRGEPRCPKIHPKVSWTKVR